MRSEESSPRGLQAAHTATSCPHGTSSQPLRARKSCWGSGAGFRKKVDMQDMARDGVFAVEMELYKCCVPDSGEAAALQ